MAGPSWGQDNKRSNRSGSRITALDSPIKTAEHLDRRAQFARGVQVQRFDFVAHILLVLREIDGKAIDLSQQHPTQNRHPGQGKKNNQQRGRCPLHPPSFQATSGGGKNKRDQSSESKGNQDFAREIQDRHDQNSGQQRTV